MNDRISPERTAAILKLRAEKVAQSHIDSDDSKLLTTVAVVGVGDERFGIPVDGLSGINRTPPIARLPHMPLAIRGIVQIRGELIGAVDIAGWFGLETQTTARLLAVVENSSRKLGLLVDTVLGFRDVHTEDINETFCSDLQSTGRPIQGTTKDLIALFHLEGLFESPEIAVDFTNSRGISSAGKLRVFDSTSAKKETVR